MIDYTIFYYKIFGRVKKVEENSLENHFCNTTMITRRVHRKSVVNKSFLQLNKILSLSVCICLLKNNDSLSFSLPNY